MDKELPVHRTNTAKAGELADLMGIKADLEASAAAMLASVRPEHHEQGLARPLYVAAMILYRRCFKNAVRHPIRDEHHIQINGTLDYHRHWMNQADKFAAHSVNAFEDNAVGVILNDEEIVGIATFSMVRVSEGERGAQDFAIYISRIIGIVLMPMIERLTEEVSEEAKTIPASQHRRADQLNFVTPSAAQAGLSRNSRQT